MKVQDVFSSIQGEGIRVGEPSTFIRLTGCNVKCLHCDTKYSWTTDGTDMSTEFLIETLESQKLCTKAFVITGGEPLLQQEELIKLISELQERYDSNITIETNGSIPIDSTLADMDIFWSISPKIEFISDNSFVVQYKKILKDNLSKVKRVQVKFLLEVSRGDGSLRNLKSKINMGDYSNIDVVVQPLMEWGSQDSEEELKKMRKTYSKVIEGISEWNYLNCKSIRFIGQLHKIFKVE